MGVHEQTMTDLTTIIKVTLAHRVVVDSMLNWSLHSFVIWWWWHAVAVGAGAISFSWEIYPIIHSVLPSCWSSQWWQVHMSSFKKRENKISRLFEWSPWSCDNIVVVHSFTRTVFSILLSSLALLFISTRESFLFGHHSIRVGHSFCMAFLFSFFYLHGWRKTATLPTENQPLHGPSQNSIVVDPCTNKMKWRTGHPQSTDVFTIILRVHAKQ